MAICHNLQVADLGFCDRKIPISGVWHQPPRNAQLGAMGTLVPSLEIPEPTFPQLVPGSSWVADIQLVDNDNWDFSDGGVAPTDGRKYFAMFLRAAGYPPLVGEEQKRTSRLFSTDDPEGSWSVAFIVPEYNPLDPAFELAATPRGGGCWAVRFTRTS